MCYDSRMERITLGEIAKDILIVLVSISVAGSWIRAVIHDAKNDRPGWVALDIIIPPVGIIRGFPLMTTANPWPSQRQTRQRESEPRQ